MLVFISLSAVSRFLGSASGFVWKCGLVTAESTAKHIDLKSSLAKCVQLGSPLLKTWGLIPAAAQMTAPELIHLQNTANDTCLFLNEALLHNKGYVVHRIINVRWRAATRTCGSLPIIFLLGQRVLYRRNLLVYSGAVYEFLQGLEYNGCD